MRRAMIAVLLVCLLAVCMAGCKKAPADDGEPYAQNVQDKDFSSLRTAGSQEERKPVTPSILPLASASFSDSTEVTTTSRPSSS